MTDSFVRRVLVHYLSPNHTSPPSLTLPHSLPTQASIVHTHIFLHSQHSTMQQQQQQQEQQPMVNIETFVLKVNVNCEGCQRKVKKILNKIEGVYMVSIDAEQQKVIVQGIVEPSAVIKKLMRSGKQAELWPQKSKQQDNNNNNQRKIKNRDQLVMNPNPLAVIETESGPWGYGQGGNLQQGMVLDPREAENLIKGIPGNYSNDINSMMQMMAIQDHHHQGYDFGAAVKNNFQQFPNYPCGPSGYGYPQQLQQQQANLLGSQYNQNHPYGGSWLRANPQNMQAIMNNRMLDGYMHLQNHY